MVPVRPVLVLTAFALLSCWSSVSALVAPTEESSGDESGFSAPDTGVETTDAAAAETTADAGGGTGTDCAAAVDRDSCYDTDGCTIDWDDGSCRARVCGDLFGGNDCEALVGCEWLPRIPGRYDVCNGIGAPIPCWLFSTALACPSDRCVFDDVRHSEEGAGCEAGGDAPDTGVETTDAAAGTTPPIETTDAAAAETTDTSPAPGGPPMAQLSTPTPTDNGFIGDPYVAANISQM